MSLQIARLSWSLVLEPVRGGLVEAPPWPAGLAPVAPVPPRDPIDQVLEGPFPQRVLGRGVTDGIGWTVSGLGRSVAWTAVASWEAGEEDGESPAFPTEALRASAVAALFGESTLPEFLYGLEDDWQLVGVAELHASLWMGLLDEPPPRSGAVMVGDCVVARGVGAGDGHVAFEAKAGFRGTRDRPVASQRLRVLCEGWRERSPAPAEYGALALGWGSLARAATRRAAALNAVTTEAELACGWAVAGGPWPGDPPDLPRLAARLDALRVGLRQDLEQLDALAAPLRRAATRLLGEAAPIEPGGPCPEASGDGRELVDRLRALERSAERWAVALGSSRALLD